MKLNDKIYFCRKKARLSQEALAEHIGVSRQAISKWETGEAAPEITKLPLLASVFQVTADWLLDDSAEPPEDMPPEDPQEPAEDASSAPSDPDRGFVPPVQPSMQTYPDWVDKLPGWIARMLKRYGWIFGLRIAISGALFTAIGFVAKAMFGSMNEMVSDGFGSLGSPFSGMDSTMIFYDSAGKVISPGGTFGNSTFGASASMPEPFSILCNFIIFMGLVMLIGGALLAWYLKKEGQENL